VIGRLFLAPVVLMTGLAGGHPASILLSAGT